MTQFGDALNYDKSTSTHETLQPETPIKAADGFGQPGQSGCLSQVEQMAP